MVTPWAGQVPAVPEQELRPPRPCRGRQLRSTGRRRRQRQATRRPTRRQEERPPDPDRAQIGPIWPAPPPSVRQSRSQALPPPAPPMHRHRHRAASGRRSAGPPPGPPPESREALDPAAPFTGVARLSRRRPRGATRGGGSEKGGRQRVGLGFRPPRRPEEATQGPSYAYGSLSKSSCL
jgi:hypothetical protein